MKAIEQMEVSNSEMQTSTTKRQRYNQRPGRQAVVRIPIDGLLAPVEVAIVGIDPRSGTVELEIPVTATIGHRTNESTG
jgi:hypothetical protein